LKPITQYAVIVRIPNIYISAEIYKTRQTKNQVIDEIIRNNTDIELPLDARKFHICEFKYKEDFETNCLLVRITSLDPFPGLWELIPGYNIPHKNLEQRKQLTCGQPSLTVL